VNPKTKPAGLTKLGKGPSKPSRKLESFPNPRPGRDTAVTFHCQEFTCLCPVTGQPDFAQIDISYIPAARMLESKSLKLYLWTYRDKGVFHETLTNDILDDLAAFLKPKWIQVVGRFNIRGGISIDVAAEKDFRES
jgi:7-cyano-7-deazaguanine reductase